MNWDDGESGCGRVWLLALLLGLIAWFLAGWLAWDTVSQALP